MIRVDDPVSIREVSYRVRSIRGLKDPWSVTTIPLFSLLCSGDPIWVLELSSDQNREGSEAGGPVLLGSLSD